MKIIVVGAGIVGLCITRALAAAGCNVVLIDQWGVGGGTSSTTFAWINANGKTEPPAYFRLNMAGMQEHVDLARRNPGWGVHHRSGSLFCADHAGEEWLRDHVGKLGSLGYPADIVDADAAHRIAGTVRLPPRSSLFGHFPSEAYVEESRLMDHLAADARRLGAEFTMAEVTEVGETAFGATVSLADGAVRTADRVVLTTGRWTESLAATADLDVPMVTDIRPGSPIVGLLGRAQSLAVNLRCVLHTPGLNLRPTGPGGFMVQALDLNRGVDPAVDVDDQTRDELTHRLSGFVPEGHPAPTIEPTIGVRSMPADGLSIVGYPGPRARIYTAVTHSGITLGPLLGRLVANEVTTDGHEQLLEDFRPARLARQRP